MVTPAAAIDDDDGEAKMIAAYLAAVTIVLMWMVERCLSTTVQLKMLLVRNIPNPVFVI